MAVTIPRPKNDAWQSQSFPMGSDFRTFEEALSRIHSRWEITSTYQRDFCASIASCPIDDLRLTYVDTLPLAGRRDPKPVNSTAKELVSIVLVEEGTSVLKQANRSVRLRPGAITVWNNSKPTQFEATERVQLLSLIMPAQQIRDRAPGVDKFYAGIINSGYGAGHLLASHIKALIKSPPDSVASDNRQLANATLQLAAYCLNNKTPEHRIRNHTDQLRTEIRDYILARLMSPNLSPSRIAAAFNISTTYLHRIFQSEPFTVSEFIREKRLAGARQDLKNPNLSHLTVTDICFRWGFGDLPYFSRLYRTNFGTPPSKDRPSN